MDETIIFEKLSLPHQMTILSLSSECPSIEEKSFDTSVSVIHSTTSSFSKGSSHLTKTIASKPGFLYNPTILQSCLMFVLISSSKTYRCHIRAKAEVKARVTYRVRVSIMVKVMVCGTYLPS
jgi:hypothetical protein